MNRLKKEKQRKLLASLQYLTPEDRIAANLANKIECEVLDLASKLHLERFPEEYDYISDSVADSIDRKRGINPMSKDYIKQVADKRSKWGVSQLNEAGLAVSGDSMGLCRREAEKTVYSDLS
jgi:hypothetical protein